MKNTMFIIFIAVAGLSFTSLAPSPAQSKRSKAVPTWYKVQAKGFSKMLKATEIVIVVPGPKSKERRTKIMMGRQSTYLKTGLKIKIGTHGNGSEPTPTAQSVSTISTVSNNEFTATTTTTVHEDGKVTTKTTRTDNQSGSESTITVTTTSDGETTVETDPES